MIQIRPTPKGSEWLSTVAEAGAHRTGRPQGDAPDCNAVWWMIKRSRESRFGQYGGIRGCFLPPSPSLVDAVGGITYTPRTQGNHGTPPSKPELLFCYELPMGTSDSEPDRSNFEVRGSCCLLVLGWEDVLPKTALRLKETLWAMHLLIKLSERCK